MIVTNRSNWKRQLLIVIGITTVLQGLLYWESFLGRTVLLPVGILKRPGIFGVEQAPPEEALANYGRADLVQINEPNRWFMAAEYRSGRIPLWTPYRFAGTSMARASVFCPYEFLYVFWPTPRILPWIQLSTALVSATGAWFFASRILRLGILASVTAGVVYPMTGFLVIWQGFDLSYPATFLPWTASAAAFVSRNPSGSTICALAIATCLTIVSGPADMAAMVLVLCGLSWVLHITAEAISTGWSIDVRKAILSGSIGWLLGVSLATPAILPAFDYIRTGLRFATRVDGFEARPPVGWKALPLIVFPEAFGTEADNSIFLHPSGSRLESAAGAYAGCIALFFVAPWAWLDCSRRRIVVGMIMLSILCLAWQLNIPGITTILRLPGFRSFSANRMVFACAWLHLMLAVIGLEQLHKSGAARALSLRHPALMLTLFAFLSTIVGLTFWPGELRETVQNLNRGLPLKVIQSSFASAYYFQIVWLLLTMFLWRLSFAGKFTAGSVGVTSILMILEPFLRVWGLHSQPLANLYYPKIPALEFVQESPDGRAIGIGRVPPNLLEAHKLKDIRGYDGVDPYSFVEALTITEDPEASTGLEYARTMWFVPQVRLAESTVQSFRIHPILDMLNLRYMILPEGVAQGRPDFSGGGLAVFKNHTALPRVWVPQRVRQLPAQVDVLRAMMPWDFNPAAESLITESLPATFPDRCSGIATLVKETPQLLRIDVEMGTAGLVVVSDRFADGWQANVDGKAFPVICVNHVLRGVFVPAGKHQIEMRYCPASFTISLWISTLSAVTLLLIFCRSISRRIRISAGNCKTDGS